MIKTYKILNLKDFGINIDHLRKNLSFFFKKIEDKNFPKCNLKFIDDKINFYYKKEYSKKDKYTSLIYETINKSPIIYEFGYSSKIIKILKKFKIQAPLLGTTPLIRIDRPHDKIYSTPWHQDKWYSGNFYKNSYVLWIPLSFKRNLSGIEIYDNKKDKLYKVEKRNKKYNEPYTISKDYKLSEKKIKKIFLKKNQCILFSQYLLHRSLINNTNYCRISLQLRFNDAYKNSVAHHSFSINHSAKVVEFLKKLSS